MPASTCYREAILDHLDQLQQFTSARAIAAALHLPYKTVIDALQALHNTDKVARKGRKFSAQWGSKRLVESDSIGDAWKLLAGLWYGPQLVRGV